MGRGGRLGNKLNSKRKVRSKDKGSDESDEDYTMGEDEEFEGSEDYCSSLAGDESEESGEFEEVEEKVRKVVKSKGRKGSFGRRKSEVKKPRGRKRVSYEEDDDEDYADEDNDDDDDEEFKADEIDCVEDDEEYKPDEIVCVEDDEEFKPDEVDCVDDDDEEFKPDEVDCVDDDDEEFKPDEVDCVDDDDEEFKPDEVDCVDDDDEEFKPDEVDCVDDDEEFKPDESDCVEGDEEFKPDESDFVDEDEEFKPDESDCVDDEDEFELTKKNKKLNRPPTREKGLVKGWAGKRKRNSKIVKKPMRKKPRKNHGLGRKSPAGSVGEFIDKKSVLKDRSKKNSGRRRKLMAHSDSDFVSSESSDFEYTISEEEREQVREANKLRRSLTTSLRSSSKIIEEEEEVLCQQRKRPQRKGKEKVEDLNIVVGKQVCGICLSEEGKKSVRGTLSCCSHYFCFACIMEWSKVESRCPLCKQRFTTISKPTRSNAGFDLRTAVIQVPERDQVYQPSEEELRGYLDPYESVICTECQQGGDDALMLLCDICDSPAHTYCIGLGREVPEGNWYCEGCRPTALGSSTPRAPNPTPDHRTSANSIGDSSPAENFGEGLDLNVMYVPDTPLTQGPESLSSPRSSIRDNRATSPVSRVGASTVSERRRIQRQINHLLNNRMSHLGGRANGFSATNAGSNFFGSQIGLGRDLAYQRTMSPERAPTRHTSFGGSFQDHPTHLLQNRDLFSARLSHSMGQTIQGQTSTSTDASSNGGINMGINSRSVYELHPCSIRSSFGSDSTMSPYMNREVSHSPVEKEQVQSMVRNRLKGLSGDMELGYSSFKDIARRSTHTILAACGLEHRQCEVHPVQPPSICNHVEQLALGQMSLMKGHCSSCFDLFVTNVIIEITNTRVHPWFRG